MLYAALFSLLCLLIYFFYLTWRNQFAQSLFSNSPRYLVISIMEISRENYTQSIFRNYDFFRFEVPYLNLQIVQN